MELFQLYSGGMTNVNSADIWRMQYSTYFALENMVGALAYSSINRQFALSAGTPTANISGGQWRVSLKRGYYMINGQLSLLKSDTYTDLQDFTSTGYIYENNANDYLIQKAGNGYSDYFLSIAIQDNYDPLGDKTFADGNVRQTWLKREFTVSFSPTPTSYLLRVRIKDDGSDVQIVEYPTDINKAFAYRYGNTLSESDFLSPLYSHNARTKLMTQHSAYLLNGGYLNGVANIPYTDTTITATSRSEIYAGLAIQQCMKYSVAINAQDLFDNAVTYYESPYFKPDIQRDSITDIIIDKVEFVKLNGIVVEKTFSHPYTAKIDFTAGKPSLVTLEYKDMFDLDSGLIRIYSMPGYPQVTDNVNITTTHEIFAYNPDYVNNSLPDGGAFKNGLTNLALNYEAHKAPENGTDFDNFKISYRFRIDDGTAI